MTAQPNNSPQRTSPHSLGHRVSRFTWGVAYTVLFRFSPRNMHRWRNWILCLFGARLHPTSRVYPRARIWAPWNLTMEERATIGDDVDVYSVERITIGARSVVSQYSYLCGATHDHELASRPLVPKPIAIGCDAWIAADVFVAPGVTIGDGVVVGARSSVFSDLPPWKVCVGSPAKPVSDRVLRSDLEEQS